MANFVKRMTSFFTASSDAAGGVWVKTDAGIKIWNHTQGLGETVIWSGLGDADGYATGRGSLQFFQDERVIMTYEGQMSKGRFHGKGLLKWSNGNSYDGDFVCDQQMGKGILRWANGDSYEGDFLYGERTGKGIFIWANGESYEGDFVDGVHHGNGIFKFANSSCYIGDLVEGDFHGKGVYKFADGDFYEGNFAHDEFSGYGTLYNANRIVIKQGLWEKDKFIGQKG